MRHAIYGLVQRFNGVTKFKQAVNEAGNLTFRKIQCQVFGKCIFKWFMHANGNLLT